ncbi:MAG: Inner membrane protein YbaN [Chloroflexi bacterium OLB13]|nr:MAG: Inner membrane protein YbaN [Chloroflexi bacterium OLB13]
MRGLADCVGAVWIGDLTGLVRQHTPGRHRWPFLISTRRCRSDLIVNDSTPRSSLFKPLSAPVRYALIALGFVFVAAGLIGAVIPGLPSTMFFVVAAICFGRASERWYQWLVTRPFVGKHFHTFMQGKGLTSRAKTVAIAACWIMLLALALTVVISVGGRIALMVTALIQAAVVLRVPTYVEPELVSGD